MDEVEGLTDQQLSRFLVQFFFSHCENTYFSQQWWDSLREADQNYVTNLMKNSNPYANPPNYDLNRSLEEWRLIERRASKSTVNNEFFRLA